MAKGEKTMRAVLSSDMAMIATVAVLIALPAKSATDPDRVPVVKAPAGPMRCHVPSCVAHSVDMGTLWSGPNGSSLWLPPNYRTSIEGNVLKELPHVRPKEMAPLKRS